MRQPPEDPLDDAVALHQQALDLRERHRRVEAEAAARRALELFETHAGADDPDVANVANLLSTLRVDADDLAEAEALSRRAVAIVGDFPDGEEVLDRLRVQSIRGLAHVLRRQGRHPEAEDHLHAALALARGALGAGGP